jgi:hypothetical protein
MSGEEELTFPEFFVPDDLVLFGLFNPVDEQKRLPVGQEGSYVGHGVHSSMEVVHCKADITLDITLE